MGPATIPPVSNAVVSLASPAAATGLTRSMSSEPIRPMALQKGPILSHQRCHWSPISRRRSNRRGAANAKRVNASLGIAINQTHPLVGLGHLRPGGRGSLPCDLEAVSGDRCCAARPAGRELMSRLVKTLHD